VYTCVDVLKPTVEMMRVLGRRMLSTAKTDIPAYRGLGSGFLLYGVAGGIVSGHTRMSPFESPLTWSISLSWNESRWSTIASVLISTCYVLGRHGALAASRVGPFLASFGVLSPSVLGIHAPISIGPFHLTFPPRDISIMINTFSNMEETRENALQLYRSSWKFANERPGIEAHADAIASFFSTFVFTFAAGENRDGKLVLTRDQINNIEILEGDEIFGKIIAMAIFNVMDLNGDGTVTLEEALVGGLILFDAIIEQPEGYEAKLARLQDVSFRIIDAKSTNSIDFSDWRYWCARMYEVNERPSNDFHFNVNMEGKQVTIAEVKRLGKLDAVLDMLTRDVLMAEYDINKDGKITMEEFTSNTSSNWKDRFNFAKWIYDNAKTCNGGKYVMRVRCCSPASSSSSSSSRNSSSDVSREATLTIQL